MDLAIAIISALAAVGAAVAAFGSWTAAKVANRTTAAMAAIEGGRRRDELAPDFDITCVERATAPDSADLRVSLKPGRLESIDDVTITILDEADRDHWARGLPDGVTQEEAEAFVWGPWEFNTGASAQVISNRTTRARSYNLMTGKNWDLLGLRRTRAGHWMSATSQDAWRKQHMDQPLRLLIRCRQAGQEPWLLLREVTTKPEGPFLAT